MESAIGPTSAPLKDVYWARVVSSPPAGASWKMDGRSFGLWGLQSLRAKEFRYFDARGNMLIKRTPFDLEVTGAVIFEYSQDEHDPFDSGSAGYGGADPSVVPLGVGTAFAGTRATSSQLVAALNDFDLQVPLRNDGSGYLKISPQLLNANGSGSALRTTKNNNATTGAGQQSLLTCKGGYDWQAISNPGSGLQASIVIGASAGVIHVLDTILASASNGNATQKGTLLQVLDGVTTIAIFDIELGAAIGAKDSLALTNLGLKSSSGNSLTVQYSAAMAAALEYLTIGGYDQ